MIEKPIFQLVEVIAWIDGLWNKDDNMHTYLQSKHEVFHHNKLYIMWSWCFGRAICVHKSMTFSTKPKQSVKRQNVEKIRYQWRKNKVSIWMCAASSSIRSPKQRVNCNWTSTPLHESPQFSWSQGRDNWHGWGATTWTTEWTVKMEQRRRRQVSKPSGLLITGKLPIALIFMISPFSSR